MAPEVSSRGGGDGDMWSLGCTVIEMTIGQPPWGDISGSPLFALYKIGFSDECPEFPIRTGEEFPLQALNQDPVER